MALGCLVLALLFVVARIEAIGVDEQKLRDAIVKGTELTLTKDIVLTQDLPSIPAGKTVSIRGSGSKPVKIDGNGRYAMFRGTGAGAVTLSLTNLEITRAKPSANGLPAAAVDIRALNSKLTISKVTFLSNARALHLSGATAKISNSKFNGHSKTAVVALPDIGSTSVTFSSCSFTENKADDSIGGGAIHVGESNSFRATVTASKTTFTRNSAAKSVGGAVRLREFATGTFRDCTFTKNSSPDGGAIAVFNSYFSTVRCTFKENTAGIGGAVRMSSDGEGRNSLLRTTFTANKASEAGGAFIFDNDIDITFCRCTFASNTAKGRPNNGFGRSYEIIFTNPFTTIPLVTVPPGEDPIEFRNTTRPCVS